VAEEKKKKGLSGSWIDEILGGKSDPLASVFDEKKKEEKKGEKPLPFLSEEKSPLESILEGKEEKKEGGIISAVKKEENPKPTRREPGPLQSILAAAKEEEKKEKETKGKPERDLGLPGVGSLSDILSRPAEKKSKKTSSSADLLGQLLGGGASPTGSQPAQPARSRQPLPKPKGKPSLGLQNLLSETKTEEMSYAGRAKVLDAYGNVRVLKVKGEPVPIYEIRLPKLSKEEENLIKQVRERAITEIQIDPTLIPNYEERRRIFLREVRRMLKETAPTYSEGRVELLAELIVQHMLGYGLLDPLVRDDNLEEIMVIGTNKPVYVWHRRFYMCKTNIVFKEDRDILNIIERIAREVGRRIDQQSPLLDARLPDGSRVNATIPPISLEGPTITIRKFKKDPLTVIDLIKYGTMNTDVAAFLWILVDGLGVKPANILVAGGTGSGKTTTLNSLAMFIPPGERVISIEDTAELQLPVEH